MNIPTNLIYTQNDEWIKVEGDNATIGITDYAQDQLSDIVFVEILVEEGEELNEGDSLATVESVKAAADVYMPVAGTVIEINEDLADVPELINSDPYGDSWLVKFTIGTPDELEPLLDNAGYEKHIESREE